MTYEAITPIFAIATSIALYAEWRRTQAEQRAEEEAIPIPVRIDEHLPR